MCRMQCSRSRKTLGEWYNCAHTTNPARPRDLRVRLPTLRSSDGHISDPGVPRETIAYPLVGRDLWLNGVEFWGNSSFGSQRFSVRRISAFSLATSSPNTSAADFRPSQIRSIPLRNFPYSPRLSGQIREKFGRRA